LEEAQSRVGGVVRLKSDDSAVPRGTEGLVRRAIPAATLGFVLEIEWIGYGQAYIFTRREYDEFGGSPRCRIG
jgi:hypothetical protein